MRDVGVKRKQHSAEFKARVAMASLSGEKTLAELSAQFGVHPTMISNWKQELMKRAGELFARGSKAPAVEDAQKDDLHGKIGQLQGEPGLQRCLPLSVPFALVGGVWLMAWMQLPERRGRRWVSAPQGERGSRAFA